MTDVGYDVEAFDRFEQAGWESCANAYLSGFGPMIAVLAEPLLDAGQVAKGSRVLDLGCGSGQIAAAAARRGADARGVDTSSAMVAHAIASNPGLQFDVSDASNLPYADGAFDAVLANALVLHLGRPLSAVREAARVLTGGGMFACTTYDQPQRARTVTLLLEAVKAVGPVPPRDMPPGPDMFALAADGALDRLLGDAGFEDRRVTQIAINHELADAAVLWIALAEGTVRAGALLRAQPPDRLARIRAEFIARAEQFRVGDRLVIPTSYLLASGRKPSQ